MVITLDPELQKPHIGQLREIDFFAYGFDSPRIALELAERNPWVYRVLRRGNEVLGYTLVLPLRRVAHEEMVKGRLSEEELEVTDIDEISPGGIYISSVASAKAVKDSRFIKGTLVGVVVGQLSRSSLPVSAVPITRAGKNIARMLRMRDTTMQAPFPQADTFKPTVYIGEPNYRTPLNIGN